MSEYISYPYAMFSQEGGDRVSKLVDRARLHKWSYNKVCNELYKLSRGNLDKYGEATDTAVRESVAIALGLA